VLGAKRTGLLGIQVRTGKWQAATQPEEADLVIDSIASLPEVLEFEKGDA
jgi:phosphoglycolate phosphatase-like HAD superfamily hydrolase